MSPHERGTHLFKKSYTAGRVEDFQPEAPSSNPMSSKSKLLKHQGRKQSQAFSLHRRPRAYISTRENRNEYHNNVGFCTLCSWDCIYLGQMGTE